MARELSTDRVHTHTPFDMPNRVGGPFGDIWLSRCIHCGLSIVDDSHDPTGWHWRVDTFVIWEEP